MQDKIQLKEIAGYLPYGLKCEHGNAVKFVSLDFEQHKNSIAGVFDSGYKPRLRPLSQLTEEITHKGETFVPLVELAKMVNVTAEMELDKSHLTVEWNNGTNVFYWYQDQPVWQTRNSKDFFWEREWIPDVNRLFQKLYEFHFDLYGLIERGLALPIENK